MRNNVDNIAYNDNDNIYRHIHAFDLTFRIANMIWNTQKLFEELMFGWRDVEKSGLKIIPDALIHITKPSLIA